MEVPPDAGSDDLGREAVVFVEDTRLSRGAMVEGRVCYTVLRLYRLVAKLTMPILSQFEAFWQSLQPQLGAMMMLPTEPIGSIPRPASLIVGIQGFRAGRISQAELCALYHAAVQETMQRLEATGSPVIMDGEQAKHSFATYSIYGLENLAPDGMPILFADGHIRNFPRLTAGPLRYKTPADVYLEIAQRYAHMPLKQAVVSASALSLLYPPGGIRGYSREQYLDALVAEQEGEIRRCLHKGAHVVQIDFTEGRLSIHWQRSWRTAMRACAGSHTRRPTSTKRARPCSALSMRVIVRAR